MFALIAPVRCVSCGAAADGDLCRTCATHVRVLDVPVIDTPFGRAASLVAFAEPSRRLTLHLKRRGAYGTARAMGRLLADLARREHLSCGVIAFVPGGHDGFDHAELLARAIAHELDLPVRRLLRRAQHGPRQADVSLEERFANVRDRFAARPVHGDVLLVDDVFTTGATSQACADALRGVGAQTVDVLTWARTLRRSPSRGPILQG